MTSELRFYYDKSPFHQEIEVDGAIGGVSPTGDKIIMSIYTERPTIPKVVVHNLDDNGKLLDEVDREGKVGMERIVQATLHMNLEQAKAIATWLEQQVLVQQGVKDGGDV